MLTPSKIKNHHFEITGKNAYRAQSVDEFFEIVADSYEQMFKENGELVKKLGLLAERLEEYKNDEDNIRAALLTAQRMADHIMKETNQKADARLAEVNEYVKKQEIASDEKATKLVEDAREKAELIVAEANNKANQIIEDATLESKEQEVVARDRMIKAQAGLDLIEKEADKFKRQLLTLYSEHIELINKIPELEGSDEAVEVVDTVEQEDDEEPVKIYETEPEEPENNESELEEAPDYFVPEEDAQDAEPEEVAEEEEIDKASVDELISKYLDAEAEAEEAVEELPLEAEEVYEEYTYDAEEPEAIDEVQPDAEIIEPVADEVIDAVEETEEVTEPVEIEEDEDDGGFKFDLSAFNFGEEEGTGNDEYYDDEDGDEGEEYYDDDDEDEDNDEGFSSKFKGFFKR